MADGLNRVHLIGNLGADPELRMTNGGQAVLTMRLATSRTYIDGNRQKQQDVQWHQVVVWGKSAEGLGKFLTKGMRLYIEGRIAYRQYEDREGNKRYSTEIVAESTIVLTERHDGGLRGRSRGDNPRYDERDPQGDEDPTDDIPF